MFLKLHLPANRGVIARDRYVHVFSILVFALSSVGCTETNKWFLATFPTCFITTLKWEIQFKKSKIHQPAHLATAEDKTVKTLRSRNSTYQSHYIKSGPRKGEQKPSERDLREDNIIAVCFNQTNATAFEHGISNQGFHCNIQRKTRRGERILNVAGRKSSEKSA